MALAQHALYQQTVAGLFSQIGGEDIRSFRSSLGTGYVVCQRESLEWMFSVQTANGSSHFILTRSDLDRDGYLLVGYKLEDVTSELGKLIKDPEYVIKRNDMALRLQEMKDILTR